MNRWRAVGLILSLVAGAASAGSAQTPAATERAARIHERFVFADIHAHPSRFHRANVARIEADEIARYRRGLIDLVVCNVSSDAAFQGGYTAGDGTTLRRLQGNNTHPLEAGNAFAFTLDRLDRVFKTIESGEAALASSPEAVLQAKQRGQLALLPALEGADGSRTICVADLLSRKEPRARLRSPPAPSSITVPESGRKEDRDPTPHAAGAIPPGVELPPLQTLAVTPWSSSRAPA